MLMGGVQPPAVIHFPPGWDGSAGGKGARIGVQWGWALGGVGNGG